jgi:hypothetical protein
VVGGKNRDKCATYTILNDQMRYPRVPIFKRLFSRPIRSQAHERRHVGQAPARMMVRSEFPTTARRYSHCTLAEGGAKALHLTPERVEIRGICVTPAGSVADNSVCFEGVRSRSRLVGRRRVVACRSRAALEPGDPPTVVALTRAPGLGAVSSRKRTQPLFPPVIFFLFSPDCPAGIRLFGRTVGVTYRLHFSATSVKILFARIDRAAGRVELYRVLLS